MYKELIQKDLIEAKKSVCNVDKTQDELNNMIAEKEAAIMIKYIKKILIDVVGAGVPTPQDGGAALKASMMTKINTII